MNKLICLLLGCSITNTLSSQTVTADSIFDRTVKHINFTTDSLDKYYNHKGGLYNGENEWYTLTSVAFYNSYISRVIPDKIITPILSFSNDRLSDVAYYFDNKLIILNNGDSSGYYNLWADRAFHCGKIVNFHFWDVENSKINIYFNSDTVDALNPKSEPNAIINCEQTLGKHTIKLCEYKSKGDSVYYKEFLQNGQIKRSGTYYQSSISLDSVTVIDPITLEEWRKPQKTVTYKKCNDWRIFSTNQ